MHAQEPLDLTLADEAFLLVAELHRRNPARADFRTSEVIEFAKRGRLSHGSITSLGAHLSSHNVANKAPSPDRHRMLYSTAWGRIRLLEPKDPVDPGRTGKQFPDEADLDAWGKELVAWAKRRFEDLLGKDTRNRSTNLMSFAGVATGVYGDVDKYVDDLRKDWAG